MIALETVLAYLAGLGLTISAVVFATYKLFQLLGKKWIEGQFEKSLEEFRHEKLRELEALRLELNTKLNRATILNEREFEVLPRMYQELNVAHGAVASFTSPMQSHVDVDRMGGDALLSHLRDQKFKEFEIEEVLLSKPKSDRYRDILFWKELNASHDPYRQFNNYLVTNSIFVDDALRESFEEVRDLMSEALLEAQHEKQFPDPRPDRWKAREALRKNGRAKINDIREEVRNRLIELRTLDPSHSSA